MALSFKGAHFPQEITLIGVRWYVASPLSYRHVGLRQRNVFMCNPHEHNHVQDRIMESKRS